MNKIYTNTPLNYVYKKNIKYKWKPLVLISVVMVSMMIVKMTVKPEGTFEDLAVMTSNFNVLRVDTAVVPEPDFVDNEFYFPLDGPITSVFAIRNDPFGSGELEDHEGIDIAAIYCTEVRTVMDGKVKAVGRSYGYGNYVIVDHGGGMDTLYAHCEEVYSCENDEVKAGDIIAKAGNTGRSTAPHLHFEVRINGVKVDPLPYLER